MAGNENAAPRGSGGGVNQQGGNPWREIYSAISGAATKGSGESGSRQRDLSPLPAPDTSVEITAPATSSHEVRPRASTYALPSDLAARFSARACSGFVCRVVDAARANFHAVETSRLEKQTHPAALCGDIPGLRTKGWSENTGRGVSCKRCVAKLRRLESEVRT